MMRNSWSDESAPQRDALVRLCAGPAARGIGGSGIFLSRVIRVRKRCVNLHQALVKSELAVYASVPGISAALENR